MALVLVVSMKAKEGAEEEAAEVMRELAEASRQEPGTELYVPCRDPDDPGSFLLFEQYQDRAAFDAHAASEHFQRLGPPRLFELMESRERNFYETL